MPTLALSSSRAAIQDAEIVVRTDSAAATHQFTDELRAARVGFAMGLDLTEGVCEEILGLPEAARRPAISQDGEPREGAWVAELTDHLDLTTWPDGSRVMVRRERPHPGAQLSFSDQDGHRFLATLTDLDGDPVELERLHRGRANAEDRVRNGKQTGMENLPFRDFDHNAVWLEVSLLGSGGETLPSIPPAVMRQVSRARSGHRVPPAQVWIYVHAWTVALRGPQLVDCPVWGEVAPTGGFSCDAV